MIEAAAFVESARRIGYSYYAGVPCSFLTPFINYTIGDPQLRYVSSANEGDALAAGAGAVLGGGRAVVMMQNSGLGNAINPLVSLAHVFRIPLLLIVTLRGDPSLDDEPQHRLMGDATPTLFEALDVPWAWFPAADAEIEPVLAGAEAYAAAEQRPYALIMRKNTVAPYALPASPPVTAAQAVSNDSNSPAEPVKCLTRSEVLARIIERTDDDRTVIIATTGYTGRELFALADRPGQFYMVGSMGCAPALALGLAMTRPDLRVVVIDGDGAALMRMGNFATVGAYGGSNLIHILLDNEAHDSTGAQATVSAGVSFSRIASACGYPSTWVGDDLCVIDAALDGAPAQGPRFAHLKIRTGAAKNLPRPTLSPEQVCARLMAHIGAKRVSVDGSRRAAE